VKSPIGIPLIARVIALHDLAFARHGDTALAGLAPTGGDIEVAGIGVQCAERSADAADAA